VIAIGFVALHYGDNFWAQSLEDFGGEKSSKVLGLSEGIAS